jgi:diacylglycerol O-acyltransferase / wax synthase
MNQQVAASSMSAIDAAFLYLERKDLPLNIASVCIFDGPVPFQEFVASINSKLHLVPRYRQIPVLPPWNLSFPSWQDDPHFDIYRHILRVTLEPPGGQAELEALAGRILSSTLDRSRPLWDMHVVDGLKDGRGAVIWRLHHSLADGVSGTELMKTFLDTTPEVSRTAGKRRRRAARPPDAQPSLAESISGALNNVMGSLLEFEAGLLAFSEHMLDGTHQSAIKELKELLPEYTTSIERLPFNKRCTGGRSFCWTEWNIADVQAVREAVGGTVNDVVLAVLTRALARYVKMHGQSVVNRFVRIVCPVNLRPVEKKDGIGNQISFLPVALPLDARGPVRMLQEVAARTDTLKRSGALGFVGLAAKWLAATPPPLQALFWRSIPDIILPVPLLNMICTNVPGPPTPLYAAGRRMLAVYPQVPTGWDLGVGCAVYSYEGKLFFGFIADTVAADDIERPRGFLALSFEELRRSAVQKKARRAKRAKTEAGRQEQRQAEPVRPATPETARDETKLVPVQPPAPVATHAGEAA